jgi:hypothetical protein
MVEKRRMRIRIQTIYLVLFGLFAFNRGAKSQTTATTDSVKQAINNASNSGDYNTAFQLIRRLIYMGAADSSTYVSAAMVRALQGDKESGLKYLDTAVMKGWADVNGWPALTQAVGFEKGEHLQKLYDQVKRNAQRLSENSIQPRDELQKMASEDQEVRAKLASGRASDTILAMQMLAQDSEHTRVLKSMLHGRPWFSENELNTQDQISAFLLVDHSPDTALQASALPILKQQAIKFGKPAEQMVALLEDRVLVQQGRLQIYGTQVHVEGDSLIVYPIADSVNVDSLRSSIGLPPLQQYLDMLRSMIHKTNK